MNLLLITFSFPPVGGVGVLRALSLAKHFPENGIRVDVLTARNAPGVGKDAALARQVPPEVTVHYSWTPDLPFVIRKKLRAVVSQSSPTHGKRRVGSSWRGKLRKVLSDLLLPDPQIGWLPFAFRSARQIIRSRAIDAVLITVPPFSSVRLVSLLRREFPLLPIVLDFRDEWITTTIDFVSFNKSDKARAVALRTESAGVRDASLVVAVTRAAQAELRNRYADLPSEKFTYVPNGFESRKQSTYKEQWDPSSLTSLTTLTYIGSVYGSTDPTNVVEAVLRLPEQLRAKLKLRFIGHVETQSFHEVLQRLGATVELVGFLPKAEALRALDATDYLLLISHDPINVSAKFYDYLSGSKPIVAAVRPDGELRLLLEETRAGRWADVRDVSAIATLLEDILTSGSRGTLVRDEAIVQSYNRKVLAQQYAELLKRHSEREDNEECHE